MSDLLSKGVAGYAIATALSKLILKMNPELKSEFETLVRDELEKAEFEFNNSVSHPKPSPQ